MLKDEGKVEKSLTGCANAVLHDAKPWDIFGASALRLLENTPKNII